MEYAEISRRIAYLRNYFALVEGFEVTWVALDVWARPVFVECAGPHHCLGFSPPQPAADRRPIAFMCAEVLVAQTLELDAQGYFVFVSGLLVHLYHHLLARDGLVGAALEAFVLEAQRADLTCTPFEDVWHREIG